MPVPPGLSPKDSNQVLRAVMDDANNRLRVDAVISPDGHDLEIHHEDDSIAIGTPTQLFTATTIGPKIGLDVNVINPIEIDTTGLATSDNQLTEIDLLTDISTSTDNIDGKLNTLGQKISTGSVPVVIASDQSAIPISGSITVIPSGTQDVNVVSSVEIEIKNDSGNPIPVSGTVTANIGTTNGLALDSTLTNNTQTTQLVNSTGDSAAVHTLGTTPTSADFGLLTNSLLYGLTTGGGGGYVPVKVNPSGTITADVTGTVTANAGTNLNTSLLALDSTVAKDASLTTINTSVNTLLKPANTLAAVTTVGTITNVVHVDDNGGSLTVDNAGTFPVQATLSAETTKVIGTVNQGTSPWVISGSVTANAGTNLNTSLLALDSTVAKDASLTTINTSINTLLKPANTLTAVTTLGTITNVVHVDDNAGSLTVDNAGTFAVQASQTGNWSTRTQDGAGNLLTSQTNGAQRALDVGIDVAGVQIDPRGPAPGTLTDHSGTATSTSAQIMAANASRKFLLVQNLGNAPIFINFTSAATTTSGSIEIAAVGSFIMDGSFVSTEAVNVIRTGGSNLAFTAKEG